MIPQLQQETPTPVSVSAPRWSLARKFAFRFGFAYFLLYSYPQAVGSLGALVKYRNPLTDLWHMVVPWVGVNILHLSGDFTEVANGSGDQLYDYVLIFCIVVTAAIAALVWSWFDSKRENYETLYEWLRLFVRMVVAMAMISYGANKLWRMQFAEPGLARYVDTFGQTSPMGLLWTMMGHSRLYSFFGGVGEMTGGLLLLVPQFTTLGALITGGMMTNVLLLNFGYDVPRKIYSIHLVAFCLFLLVPDILKLNDFFFLNRKTQLTPPAALFKDKTLNYGVWLLQAAIGIGALAISCSHAYKDQVKNETHVAAAMRGIWAVTDYTQDNVLRPPLLTDTERWQKLIFDDPQIGIVQYMDGTQKKYYLQLDTEKNNFVLWDTTNPHWKASFTFDHASPNRLVLNGQVGGHQVSANLDLVDMSDPTKFLLINRGVHWINAFPQNR